MKRRFLLALPLVVAVFAACATQSDNPLTPPAEGANDSAPADTSSARGPGMMGGGG